MNPSSFHHSFPFLGGADQTVEKGFVFEGHQSLNSLEDTFMFSTVHVPAVSADATTSTRSGRKTTKSREFPCKARGMFDPNHADAVVSVPQGTPHGAVIYCSDPTCVASGRAFRWCNVCECLAAKRNFGQRHGHGRPLPRSSRVEQYRYHQRHVLQKHGAAVKTVTNDDADGVFFNGALGKAKQDSQQTQNSQSTLLRAQRMHLCTPNITTSFHQEQHQELQQAIQSLQMKVCGEVCSAEDALIASPKSRRSDTGSINRSDMSYTGLDQLGDIDQIFDDSD